MKLTYTFLFSILFFNGYSQTGRAYIHSEGNDLYIIHHVSKNETYQHIGSLYSIAPDLISEFNNLSYHTDPLFATTVRVPLSKHNFSPTATGIGKTATLYYKVQAKQTLPAI